MKIVYAILRVIFLLLKWSAIAVFAEIMLVINNFTPFTEKGRRNEARRQNDEIRRLRLQRARKQSYTDDGL
jgi:hypothetical protein